MHRVLGPQTANDLSVKFSGVELDVLGCSFLRIINRHIYVWSRDKHLL